MTTQNHYWVTRKILQFGLWLQKESKPLHGNIDLMAFLSTSAVILTLSSFLYLGEYYSHFKINYFRVFNFEDGLSILYEKGRLLLLFPMTLGFIAILFTLIHIIRKKDMHKELKKNSALFFSVIFTGIMTYHVFRAVGNLPFSVSVVLGIFAAAIVVMYYLFDVRTIYFYPLLFGFGLMLCADPDIKRIIAEKVMFSITMIDEKPPVSIEESRRTFWIGSTSKIIFLYNDSLREVTEIPSEQVRKVNYFIPKASTKKQ